MGEPFDVGRIGDRFRSGSKSEGGGHTMPMYVFRCNDGHDFEKIVPMSAAAPDCPTCGHSSRKIPTTFSIGRKQAATKSSQQDFSTNALWRAAFKDKPEKVKRELEFRQQLVAKGTREQDISSPDRNLTGGVVLG